MYIDLKDIIKKFNLEIKGIVHIGGCKGEELISYLKNNIKNIILVEANPELIGILKVKKFFFHYVFRMNLNIENFAAYYEDNLDLDLNITNNLQSSSILKLSKHSELYPEIKVTKKIKVKTSTINKLFTSNYEIGNYNFLNLDIQGAELDALKGADKILDKIDAVYTEINFDELYEGCAHVGQIDDYLGKFKFKRVLTETPDHPSWGDALYLKEN